MKKEKTQSLPQKKSLFKKLRGFSPAPVNSYNKYFMATLLGCPLFPKDTCHQYYSELFRHSPLRFDTLAEVCLASRKFPQGLALTFLFCWPLLCPFSIFISFLREQPNPVGVGHLSDEGFRCEQKENSSALSSVQPCLWQQCFVLSCS